LNFVEQLTRERSEGSVNESAQQVAFADKVLLNKVDLCDAAKLQTTIEAVKGVNEFVPMEKCSLRTKPDAIPLEALLHIDAFDLSKLMGETEIDLTVCGTVTGGETAEAGHGDGGGHGHECKDESCTDEGHGHGGHGHGDGHGEGHGHGHGAPARPAFRHDTGVGSFVCEILGKPIDMMKFNQWMRDLLQTSASDLYRFKGIMCMRDCHDQQIGKFVIQGVHDIVNMDEAGEWPADAPMKSQLVLIGRNLKEEWRTDFNKLAD